LERLFVFIAAFLLVPGCDFISHFAFFDSGPLLRLLEKGSRSFFSGWSSGKNENHLKVNLTGLKFPFQQLEKKNPSE
jgi:hypothetical protein